MQLRQITSNCYPLRLQRKLHLEKITTQEILYVAQDATQKQKQNKKKKTSVAIKTISWKCYKENIYTDLKIIKKKNTGS